MFLILFPRTALLSLSYIFICSLAYSLFLLVLRVPLYHTPVFSQAPFPLSPSASHLAIWVPLSNAGMGICKVLVYW